MYFEPASTFKSSSEDVLSFTYKLYTLYNLTESPEKLRFAQNFKKCFNSYLQLAKPDLDRISVSGKSFFIGYAHDFVLHTL